MAKNQKSLIACVSTVLITASAMGAVAQQSDSSNWIQQRVAQRIVTRMEEKLKLTPQQREQAKAILQDEKPAILALAERSRQERNELDTMPQFNEAQAHAIAQKYTATNVDALVERTRVRMELRAILNDQQRRQLDQMRNRFSSHADERLGHLIDLL